MKFLVVISIFLTGFIFVNITPYAFAGVFDGPTLNVDDLVVEKYASDLCCMITTMTFVGDDVLFLQKTCRGLWCSLFKFWPYWRVSSSFQFFAQE